LWSSALPVRLALLMNAARASATTALACRVERHVDDDITTVAIVVGAKRTQPKTLGDRLGELFLEWSWATGHPID
jgi:hypothetical protein